VLNEDDTFERLKKVPYNSIRAEMLRMDDAGIELDDAAFDKFLSDRGWSYPVFVATMKDEEGLNGF